MAAAGSEISTGSSQLRNLEKEEQNQPKGSRKNERVKELKEQKSLTLKREKQ